jgi:uncharacterized phage protein (TIGR01671 family)
MRKLRFRAWDTIEKKWLFGYEYPNLGGFNLIGEVTLMGELSSVPLDKILHNVEFMQYTEVKDYNGKEIYEGDILSLQDTEGFKYEVRFEEGEFCLFSKFDKWGSISRMRPTCERIGIKINIIGNIYENPELIN